MKKITMNTQATINTTLANSLTEYAYITRFLEELTDVTNTVTSLESRAANGEELTAKEQVSLESKRIRIADINELLNADDISPYIDDCKSILASGNDNDVRTLKVFSNLYGRVHVPNCNSNKIYSAFLAYHNGEGTKKELTKALNAFLSVLKKENKFVHGIVAKATPAETDLFVAFILRGLGYDKRTGMVKINTMSQKEFNRNLFIYAVSQFQAEKVTLAETTSLTAEEAEEVKAYDLHDETDEKVKNEKISLKNRVKKVEDTKKADKKETKTATPVKKTAKTTVEKKTA